MTEVTKQDVRDAMQNTQTLFTQWAAGMEAQLAGAEKPNLGHGDYGKYDGKWFIVIEQETLPGSPKAFFDDTGGLINADRQISVDLRDGNFFRELTAMAEPLEEFVERGFNHHIHHSDKLHGSIMIRGNCYSIEQLEEYIMKLRRMAATAERARDGKTDN